jgi:hypothetical protein
MQAGFTVLGVVLLLVAAFFGFQTVVYVGGPSGTLPNVVSAGAACGFSIAGGLCFVAAAIARGHRHDEDD